MLPAENMLGRESSPYLLQHAANPVHWRPWGRAALEEAKALDRPILLSIGYAACHWCHVMAHESFENPAIAALMNGLFVNIKVDREERPDIDHIYMSSLHALGEQGGWPLTMFLTPDGAPFWGGTYWPPEPRWGRPGFRQVLVSVERTFREKPDSIAQNAAALTEHLHRLAATQPGALPGRELVARVADAFMGGIDPVNAGLGGAPKFPNAPVFRFLWQAGFSLDREDLREAVAALLRALCAGGIYDHLGGGFARYSVDAEWHVPHFEKMLYDNAQILELLALAHAQAPDPVFAQRADETVAWLDREMRGEAGPDGARAFAASLDADQEGEEGRFYVFTRAEVDAALGADAAAFAAAYDVREPGSFEGANVLRRLTPPGDAAQEATLAAGRAKLMALRATRTPPALDDKILADWNGLTIAALARAAAVFDRPSWLARAREAYRFVMGAMREAGVVEHSMRGGRVGAAGLLDDQAAMARAALALFEATGERAFLDDAISLAVVAQREFGAQDGGFFTTAAAADDVPGPRPRHATDNATPSASGLIAEVFAKLWHLTGDARWRQAAEGAIVAFSGSPQLLAAGPTLLAAADLLARGAVAVVAGEGGDALAAAALRHPDPAVALLRTRDGADWPEGSPAWSRVPVDGRPAAYVCHDMVCSLPVASPQALSGLLSR